MFLAPGTVQEDAGEDDREDDLWIKGNNEIGTPLVFKTKTPSVQIRGVQNLFLNT